MRKFQYKYKQQLNNIKLQTMEKAKVTIKDIESNYEHIINIVGNDSFINWQSFTKTSTDLNKQMEELMRALSLFRDIQQKRFLNAMKKMKGIDLPDLLKTVKAKKLPKEALKAILDKFDFDEDGKIKLVSSVEELKKESQSSFKQYTSVNEQLSWKLKETTELVVKKIHESGLYKEPPPPKELVSTFKPVFSQQILDGLKKQAKVEYMAGTDVITFQTYAQMVQNTFPLVKDEYKRLTLEAREKQRGLINESKKYIDALVEYLVNTQSLILQGQRAVTKAMGLEQKKVEDSQVALMEKGMAQSVLLVQSGLRTTVKQSLEPKHQVPFNTTKTIIKSQIQIIKEKTPFFKEMLTTLDKTPQNFQIVPLVVALTLNDFIFERYKLEEQDFMKSVTDQTLLNNPEVSNIFKEMEMAVIVLMRQCGVINQDMAKVIQMQSQQMQNSVGDLGQGMFGQAPTGGVFPGSNPIELLQNQQRQQFQQMQKASKKQK